MPSVLYDTVCLASGRVSGLLKFSDEVLVWLSVWSEVHMVKLMPLPSQNLIISCLI